MFLWDKAVLAVTAGIFVAFKDEQTAASLLMLVPELHTALCNISSVGVSNDLADVESDEQSFPSVFLVFMSTILTLDKGSELKSHCNDDATFSVLVRFRLTPKHFWHGFGNAFQTNALLLSGIFNSWEMNVCTQIQVCNCNMMAKSSQRHNNKTSMLLLLLLLLFAGIHAKRVPELAGCKEVSPTRSKKSFKGLFQCVCQQHQQHYEFTTW